MKKIANVEQTLRLVLTNLMTGIEQIFTSSSNCSAKKIQSHVTFVIEPKAEYNASVLVFCLFGLQEHLHPPQ